MLVSRWRSIYSDLAVAGPCLLAGTPYRWHQTGQLQSRSGVLPMQATPQRRYQCNPRHHAMAGQYQLRDYLLTNRKAG
jgi:hypothetical protein